MVSSSEERVVAVIMVGSTTKGTRFRPLSLNIAKPLFPLAGQPMVHHPISACKRSVLQNCSNHETDFWYHFKVRWSGPCWSIPVLKGEAHKAKGRWKFS